MRRFLARFLRDVRDGLKSAWCTIEFYLLWW